MASVPTTSITHRQSSVIVRTSDSSLTRAVHVVLMDLGIEVVDHPLLPGVITVTDDPSEQGLRTIMVVDDVPGAAQQALASLLSGNLAAMVGRYDLSDLSLAITAVQRNMIIVPRALATAAAGAPDINERQRRVLALVADGLHNGVIAERLSISPATVKREISSLLVLFNSSSRLELALAAAKAGFIEGR